MGQLAPGRYKYIRVVGLYAYLLGGLAKEGNGRVCVLPGGSNDIVFLWFAATVCCCAVPVLLVVFVIDPLLFEGGLTGCDLLLIIAELNLFGKGLGLQNIAFAPSFLLVEGHAPTGTKLGGVFVP